LSDPENPASVPPPSGEPQPGPSPADAAPPVGPSAEEQATPAPQPETSAPQPAPAAESQPEAAAGATDQPADFVELHPVPLTGPTTSDRPTAIVRFGALSMLGRFAHSLDHWRCGQKVVIKSDRGQEIGEIVCDWGGCGSPAGVPPQIRGDILRLVAHGDEVEARHLADSERRELQFCKQCIASRKLPMKLVAAEHLFGGDRIIFYFVSESRVDFRALVRDLAHEFQTRIEMRQIGVRDEARLLGDYERCGRPLCCRAWIKELEPVSMKMAKVQKATLDPTKISGRCGRLMCCLRYEHETYRELSRNLPRKNTLVGTPEGPGKVIDLDVISQMVGVLLLTGNRINVPAELITAAGAPPAAAPAKPASPAGEATDVPMEPREPRPARPPEPQTPQMQEEQAPAAPPPEQPKQDRPQDSGQPSQPAQPGQPGQPGQSDRPQGQPGRGRRRRRGRRGRNHGRPQNGGPGGAPGQGGQGPQQGGSPPPSAPPAPPPQNNG
jgi:cell fate regulator YaaT (PSP1 superfamily)